MFGSIECGPFKGKRECVWFVGEVGSHQKAYRQKEEELMEEKSKRGKRRG